jgi:dolichol-phosphate mannosyltransferase
MDSARTMVLVPTYMEAGTICRLIDQLRQHLPDARVLVVDDQSPDGTAALVQQRYASHARIEVVVRTGPRGFSPSMCEGLGIFLRSDCLQVISIDADLSHDPGLTVRMLESLEPNGLVIGSRYLNGTRQADWAVGRMLISIFGNYYIRAVTGIPVWDATSGFRCYSRAAVEAIDLERMRSEGYAFQVESLHRIWRGGCPIVEVPIVYRDRLVGTSKLSWRIVSESLRFPWRVRFASKAATRAAPPPSVSVAPEPPLQPSGKTPP